MTRRIKFITKFLAAMAVLAVYSSCMDNPCVRGEGAKTSCNEDMFLHVMNATDEVVQIGNIKLQPSEKKELTYHYYHYLTGILVKQYVLKEWWCGRKALPRIILCRDAWP